MVDDILLSPEEQDERAKKWLKDNGMALAVGIGLGLAAVTGYNYYQDQQLAKAEQASALYGAALQKIEDSSLSDIDAQLSELKSSFPESSYTSKAALLKAKQLASNDLDAALAELSWVEKNAPELGLQHAARIRQAKILIAQGELDAAKSVVSSSADYAGFESHYQELLAEVAFQQGEFSVAREHYQRAIDTLSAGNGGYAQVLSIKLDRLPDADTNQAQLQSEPKSEPSKDTAAATE